MTWATDNLAGLRGLTKVWISAVAIMATMMGAMQAYLEYEQLLDTTVSEASAVAASGAAAIVFNDAAAAGEMLAVFRAAEAITEAAFYRSDGSRLAEFHAPHAAAGESLGSQAPPLGHEFSLRELRLAQPVLLDGRSVGTIALRASLDFLYEEVLRFVGGLAAVSVLAIVFASAATGRLRQRLAEKETARRRAEAELARSRDQLRQMIVHREHLLEEEHQRIAVEIHDQLGQVLTAAMLNLRSLERSLGGLDDEARRQFAEILAQINESYFGMKNIATLLYPAVLKFGFVPAVEWLAGRLLKLAGIHWRLDVDEAFPNLPQEQSMALFRIVQEALVNVVRHAHAQQVSITLRFGKGLIDLEVADDGRGFDAAAAGHTVGFGLIGIRERAESVGGRVTITSRPGEGTRVRAAVPLVARETPAVGTAPQEKPEQ